MARVCLADPTRQRFSFTYLPTGLYSIAAVLLDAGHDVSVHTGAGPIPNCDFLGISCTIHQFSKAISIARSVVASTIVIGGAYPTSCPAAAQSPAISYGIVGPGEKALLSLISGKDPRKIPGLVYKNNGAVIVNQPENLLCSDIPEPAYRIIDSNPQLVNVSKARNYQHDGIMFQERHTPLHVRKFGRAMGELINLGVKKVHVTDEIFAGGWARGQVKMTVDALDGFESWSCRSGVREALTRRLDQCFSSSRCDGVELRVVTASARLAGEYELPGREDAELAIELLSKFGLTIHVIVGLPGETVASLEETRRWLRTIGLPVRLETFVAWPGSETWESGKEQFGFEVTAVNCHDNWVDDSAQIAAVPWKSKTIATADFIKIRNEMFEEFK